MSTRSIHDPQSRETGNLSDNPDRTGTAGRAGARTAGNGEHNIHHADCINVTKAPEETRCTQAHLSKHSYRHGGRGAGAGGTTAPGPAAATAWLSHTLQYLFFALCKTSEKRERHLSLYQNENSFNERVC